MEYWLLNAVTATRLLVCAPVWFWCWWKRPRRMVLWMFLALVWFVATDFTDGNYAREHGLESELGYWLDHLGDFAFFGAVVLSIVKGTREPALRRRLFRRPPPTTEAPPPPAAPDAPRAPWPSPARSTRRVP